MLISRDNRRAGKQDPPNILMHFNRSQQQREREQQLFTADNCQSDKKSGHSVVSPLSPITVQSICQPME